MIRCPYENNNETKQKTSLSHDAFFKNKPKMDDRPNDEVQNYKMYKRNEKCT